MNSKEEIRLSPGETSKIIVRNNPFIVIDVIRGHGTIRDIDYKEEHPVPFKPKDRPVHLKGNRFIISASAKNRKPLLATVDQFSFHF